jgi:hypothetical protein
MSIHDQIRTINEARKQKRAKRYAFERGETGIEVLEVLNAQSEQDLNATDGAYCGDVVEGIPDHIKADCEHVIQGKNNSFIVMGRDRSSTLDSGTGGAAETQTGMIDMSVGRKPYNSELNVNPDFNMDSARIYLSQKTRIDDEDYFNLKSGPSTPLSSRDSAVGIKADVIRIVGRKNIRLTTDWMVKNSHDGMVQSVGGIDLIAGNRTTGHMDVQPMVKGLNLLTCLSELGTQVQKMNILLNNFIRIQTEFNKKVQNHTHHTAFFGLKSLPDAKVIVAGAKLALETFKHKKDTLGHKKSINDWEADFLLPTGKDEKDNSSYILSRYNHVN